MNWYVKMARYFTSHDPEEPDFGDDIDPYDALDQAEKVFNVTGIRPDSTKNIRQVVMPDHEDSIIGALADGWTRVTGEADKDIWEYSFDLSVLKDFQQRGIGRQLIKNAIQQYESEKNSYEDMDCYTRMKVRAVNPHVARMLEYEFGFDCDVVAYREDRQSDEPEPAEWMCYKY